MHNNYKYRYYTLLMYVPGGGGGSTLDSDVL